MKIAIVSNKGLPDPRVEREISTLIKNDYRVYYVGKYSGSTGIVDLSSIKIYNVEGWSHRINLKIPPYYHWMKRRVGKILKEIKPDVVLVPNIYAGIMIHELGYPLVVDDRESYSYKRFIGSFYIKSNIQRHIKNLYLKRMREYERTLSEHHPILAVTRAGYIHYRFTLGSSKVYLLRNFPLRREGEVYGEYSSSINVDKIVFNYAGREISEQLPSRIDWQYMFLNYHRIIKHTVMALYKLYEKSNNIKLLVVGDRRLKSDHLIDSVGYVRHDVLYKYMAISHYGLYSYYPSIYHQFVSSLRVYMYALIGVPVIITSTFKDILEVMKDYCIVVDEDDYIDNLYKVLGEIISSFDPESHAKQRERIRRYAVTNIVWENNEQKLLEAFRAAT